MDDTIYSKIKGLIGTSEYDEALVICDELLKDNPSDARALCLRADICMANEMYDDAYTYYKSAVVSDATCDAALKGMADLLFSVGEYYKAVRVYEKAVALKKDDAELWEKYGDCLMAVNYYKMADKAFFQAMNLNHDIRERMYIKRIEPLSHFTDAEEMVSFFKEALTFFPKSQYLLFLYAAFLYEEKKDYDRAFSYYIDAIDIDKSNNVPRISLANMLYCISQIDQKKSIDLTRRWYAIDQSDPMARHAYYALCAHSDDGFRFDQDYVEELFDGFSSTFDDVLPALGYVLPDRFAALADKYVFSDEKNKDVLDAGCGTGLCGEKMLPYKANGKIASFTGVDLSAKMLEVAERKGLYDYLIKDNMITFMNGNAKSFDFILSADVLIYYSDLDPVFSAIYKTLRDDGICLFSISITGSDDYVIDNSGRYSHNPIYVKEVLQKNKFNIEYIEKCVMRTEFGKPEYGMIFVAKKLKTFRSYL